MESWRGGWSLRGRRCLQGNGSRRGWWLAWCALLLPAFCCAGPLLDLPQYPQIDAAALQRFAARTLAKQEARARAAGELGCVRHCEMLARAFTRVTSAAREQGGAAGAVAWQLVVTTTRGEAALSLPGGYIVISEDMVDSLQLSEAEVAFVIAHEAAHILLQHEAETLDYLQATLLPHQVKRTVWDLYAELDYDAGALLRLESLMQRGELEADFAGLLLGAQAGYSPQGMRGALQKIAAGDGARSGIVATHPAMARRLAQLARVMPIAERLAELAAQR